MSDVLILELGNAAPIDVVKTFDAEREVEVTTRFQRDDLGAQVTTFEIPAEHVSADDLEAIAGHPRWGARMRGLPAAQQEFYLHREVIDDTWWNAHSDDLPEWVDCPDEPELAKLIASHFTTSNHTCRVGRPKSWEEGRPLPEGYGGRDGGLAGGGVPIMRVKPMKLPRIDDVMEIGTDLHRRWGIMEQRLRDSGEPMLLRTTVGTDAHLAQNFSTSAQPASFNYIALTANTTTPVVGDTTLTAEITTAGGGLIRKQSVYSHTNGTNTAALAATFTANGSDSLPVTLGKFGIFNASSVGTMGYATLLSSTATLNASGDNLALTDTFTLT